SEGLADYQSTVEITDDQVIFGHSPAKHMLTAYASNRGRLRQDILADLPSIQEVVSADSALFSHGRRRRLFYTGAWALVSLLESSESYRPLFLRFIAAIAAGEGAPTAFWRIFGAIPSGKLDSNYRAQAAVGTATFYWTARLPTMPRSAVSLRPMNDSEVHLAWANARPLDGRYLAAIERDVAEAQRMDPHAAEPRYRGAWVALARRRGADAERDLRSLAQEHPDDERYEAAFAFFLAKQHTWAPREDWNERFRAEANRLEKVARSPWAIAELARLRHLSGDRTSASTLGIRAVEEAPDCWRCLDILAAIALADGAYGDALELERAATTLAP